MLPGTLTKVVYQGNGMAVEFPCQFDFHEREHVKVLLVDPEGKEELLAKNYFVDMAKKSVFYPGYAPGEESPENERPEVLPPGWKLVLYREVPPVQLVDLGDRWPFPVIEKMADKLTMLIQQLWEKVGRAIVFPVSEDFNAELPAPIEPGASIAVTNDGAGLRYGANPDGIEYAVQTADAAKEIAGEAIALAGASVKDAPEDGKLYGRRNGLWDETLDVEKLSTAAYDVSHEDWPSAIYNPETNMIWFGVPRGQPGDPGPTGPQGTQGDGGVQGADGPTGATGPQGQQGPPGPVGLTGERGGAGSIGATGPQGPQGPQGVRGAIGDTGAQGIKGDKGDRGEPGPPGQPPVTGLIDCGGAYQTQVDVIDAGTASDFM